MNTCRFFCCLLFYFGTSSLVVGQKVEDLLYEVTIQSGAGTYGYTSIKFQLEGMLLRTNIENRDKIERRVNFIPIEQIDSKKMLKLFDFIHKKNLMKLDYQYLPNPYYSVDIKIRLLDMNSGNYIQYRYNTYNPLFDKLIELINDLIPTEFKQDYQTQRIEKY